MSNLPKPLGCGYCGGQITTFAALQHHIDKCMGGRLKSPCCNSRAALKVAREALEAAEEVMTDAVNDYVPCRCTSIVIGEPDSHASGCSTGELMRVNFHARRALAQVEELTKQNGGNDGT